MREPQNYLVDTLLCLASILIISLIIFNLYSIKKLVRQTNQAAFIRLQETQYFKDQGYYSEEHYKFFMELLEEFYAQYGDPYQLTEKEIIERYRDPDRKEKINKILGNLSEQDLLKLADKYGIKHKKDSKNDHPKKPLY